MEQAEKTADLELIFQKVASAFDHDHPETNDYYRWARETAQANPGARNAFVDYVREMMESYGI